MARRRTAPAAPADTPTVEAGSFRYSGDATHLVGHGDVEHDDIVEADAELAAKLERRSDFNRLVVSQEDV